MQIFVENASQPSIGGAIYILLIKDECTTYMFIEIFKAKSDAFTIFIKVICLVEHDTGNRMQILKTNRGGEFCNDNFDLLLEHGGIKREISTSYT